MYLHTTRYNKHAHMTGAFWTQNGEDLLYIIPLVDVLSAIGTQGLLHTRACAHSNKTMLPATGPLTEWLKVRTYIARQTTSDKEAPKSFIVLTYGCILNLRVKQLLHQGALTPDIPKTFLQKVFTPNPPAQVQRACLSGGTSNRSALAGGGVYTFFAGKMHGTVRS